MSLERQQAILERQIEEILFGIEQAKAQKAERYTVKQMERTRKSLEQGLPSSTTRAARMMSHV